MSWTDRIAAIAGLGAAVHVLLLPGCVCDLWLTDVSADVSPDDPTRAIARALVAGAANRRVSASLALVAVFLLVVFFARLHAALRELTGPASWLPTLALVGGTLLAAVLLVDSGIGFAASELGSQTEGLELGRLFLVWEWNSASLFAPPFALALTATTVVAFTAGGFGSWYRGTSAVLLVLLLLSAMVLRAPGLAVFPGALWLFATSAALLRPAPPREPAAPSADPNARPGHPAECR